MKLIFLFSLRVTYIAYQRITKLSLRNPMFFKYTKLYEEEKHAAHVIHSFIDNVIVTRRQELVNQMTRGESTKEHANEMTNDRKSRALLDILLQTKIDGKPLTDMDIREETSSFMLAVSLVFLSNSKLNKCEIRQLIRATM